MPIAPKRARSSSPSRFLGRVISLNDLPAQLALHDIVVCSTASPLPLIGKGLVESALKARKHRPMLMFDLAVPRDIEAEVGTLDDVFLYTVDDLGKIAREGLDVRQNAVAQAEVIIENHVTDFMHWLGSREVVAGDTRDARRRGALAPPRARARAAPARARRGPAARAGGAFARAHEQAAARAHARAQPRERTRSAINSRKPSLGCITLRAMNKPTSLSRMKTTRLTQGQSPLHRSFGRKGALMRLAAISLRRFDW